MDHSSLLWIDARLNKSSSSEFSQLDYTGRSHYSEDVTGAESVVRQLAPNVIVFDFDYADINGLKSVQRVRNHFSDIPLLMLAEQHYEKLSVWALRCRVWDYLIKPFSMEELQQRLRNLVEQDVSRQGGDQWHRLLPVNRIPVEAAIEGVSRDCSATRKAVSYMESNLHEKITADAVSKHCGLNRYQLSRAFRAEFSTTFQEFLLDLRMERAVNMLCSTRASITEIAMNVGFNDLSHFTRKFHERYGKSPGVYRKEKRERVCRNKAKPA